MKWLLPILAVAGTAVEARALPRPADETRVVRECEEALRTGSDEDQLKALDRLKALAPRGRAVIPALIQYVPNAPPRQQARAVEVLAGFGPAARDALPVLADLLRRRPGPLLIEACLTAFPALGDAGNADLIRAALVGSSEGRRRAVSLQPLVDQYPDAVAPVLTEYLTDPTLRVRMRAAQHLSRAAVARGGKPAPFAAASAATRGRVIAAFWAEVRNPNEVVRECAVAGLIDLDPAALPRLMPTVIALCRDGAGQQAGSAVVRRGPSGVRSLIGYLNEPDEAARVTLIELLTGIPAAARPALADGLTRPDSVVREQVLEVLWRDGRAGYGREQVLHCLTDESPRVRLRAAQVLVRYDRARAVAAVPVLIEAAFDRDPVSRRAALSALEDLGKSGRPALPALLRRSQIGDLETRFGAAVALSAVAPETWRTYVPIATEALRDPLPGFGNVRPVLILRDAGPNARAALPLLREAMDGDPEVAAVYAAEAVVRIDPRHNDDAVDRLIRYLRWTDEEGARFPYRDPAIDAIRRLGPMAKACLPVLVEILPACRRERDACRVAVAVLAVDPRAEPALARFRAALKRTAPPAGTLFLSALDDLDAGTATALLPDLTAALSSKDGDVRGVAVSALRKLGPAAAPALPALRDLAKSGADKAHVEKAIQVIEGRN